jgi:hypothetical protein
MADVIGLYRAAGVELRATGAAEWVTARCFAGAHQDRHPSARISLRSGGFRCFTCGARGGAVAALELLGVDRRRAVALCVDYGVLHPRPPSVSQRPWQLLRAPGTARPAPEMAPSTVNAAAASATIDWDAHTAVTVPARERTWRYVDEHGVPVGRVHRLDLADGSKRIFQERPDGDGWKPGLGGALLPLYRLPQVIEHAAAGSRVLIVEGEKVVDALDRLGVFATTNAGGAGKWRSDLTASLQGAHITVIGDCDWPGRCHATDVTRELVAAGTDATMPLDLDPGRHDGYDLVDDLAELAHTLRAVEPAIATEELRRCLQRNVLNRVWALPPADPVALDRYLEQAAVSAPGTHVNADTLLRCERCDDVRPHLIRAGLAYCVCGARPQLAP